jgi:hypothetical protein
MLDLFIGFVSGSAAGPHNRNKKTDVAEHLGVFGHVGLLFNRPPSGAGLPFI